MLESDKKTLPFSSNEVRLSLRAWGIVFAIVAVLFLSVPTLWRHVERFEPGPAYRIPYSLGNDYWLYDRYCRLARAQNKTLVLGDSVVWGHYVSSEQTLSHYLNEMSGDNRFANMGADGTHPAALAGLIEYYGRNISGRNVILHCNLLWMSSRKHDLQGEKEFSFNHPKLVSQFFPNIPCYRQTYSRRIGIAMERRMPFCAWLNHLHIAFFNDMDVHNWTLENPCASPVSKILRGPDPPDELPAQRPVAESWTGKRMPQASPAWVDLTGSLQWRSFKRTIVILQNRGNRVFVLVGPFNEHMLEEESLAIYRNRKREVGAWLEKKEIPHYIAPLLPTDFYADASHPLPDGYAMLAKQLFENESFRRLVGL